MPVTITILWIVYFGEQLCENKVRYYTGNVASFGFVYKNMHTGAFWMLTDSKDKRHISKCLLLISVK